MKYHVEWVETKTTSTGKNVKNATLKTENGTLMEGVSIWSDFPGWSEIKPGSSIVGDIRANAKGYKSLSAGRFPSPSVGARPASGAVTAAKITSESVEKAQANKNASVAFFNSTNSAISLVTHLGVNISEEELKTLIVKYREWFLDEWRNYEAGDITDKTKPF